jgi:N-acetylmuramoyl-L-alanine amidase
MFQFLKSPNFWQGRFGFNPFAIVIHITDGNKESVKNWFLNPKSQVSSHYLICKNGDIIQFVDEKDTAWHCGAIKNPKWELLKPKINPNYYTIGIEFEGFDNEHLTLHQLYIGAWLLFKVSASWSIPIDLEHIIPHFWINGSKLCPGNGVNIGYLVRLAQILKNSKDI